MPVKAKPDPYHSITPYLVVEGAAGLIDFAIAAFGAQQTERLPAPEGRIGHAELRIGDSVIMLADAHGGRMPMPSMLHLYVDNADATYDRALKAGATSIEPPSDKFYGDRGGLVRDPCGNLWWIATHVEDVPPDELQRRVAALMRGAPA
jgi:PhnB protein